MPHYVPHSCGRGAQQHAWSEGTGREKRRRPTEGDAAAGQAFGEERRQARRPPGLRGDRGQKRAEQQQTEQDPERWRDHSQMQERPAG